MAILMGVRSGEEKLVQNTLNGGQVIVDYLIREKVPYAFGLCGHGNIGFIDALYERKEYQLPVVWVVWNNYAYASIRGLQRGYLEGRELATDFKDPRTGQPYNPDFTAMARSAGVEGVRVDRAADLGDAVRAAVASGRPSLIDAHIGADQNPSGAGVWELPGLGQSRPGFGGRYQPA